MNTTTEYSLKLASKFLSKATLVLLLLFLATLCVVDIPMTDVAFPRYITQTALTLAQALLIATLATMTTFVFYRKQVKVTLNEQGILVPGYEFIPWANIQWYRLDQFPNKSGVRSISLKLENSKAVIPAEESEALFRLAEDIEQRLRIHNPLAKDFRELKSSKIKAYALIFIFSAIHLGVSIYLNFQLKYIVIFTPVLFISIWAILLDHIKTTNKQG